MILWAVAAIYPWESLGWRSGPGGPVCTTISSLLLYELNSIQSTGHEYMDVGQNPVLPVNLKVDGHPLYHMISRFWPIPI
jgi:hypothetical protein